MFVNPQVVRALVRQALIERLGGTSKEAFAGPAMHPSQMTIAGGPECSEDTDFPVQRPCVIEPHRLCCNSGYCKKLGF